MQAGTLTFAVTEDKKTLRLKKVDGRSLGLETETSPADLLRVAAYLAGEAERVKDETENGCNHGDNDNGSPEVAPFCGPVGGGSKARLS